MLEIFTLFAVLIIVQTVYATVVRPRAEAIRAADLERMQKDPQYVPRLSPFVIIKDPEQETCFAPCIWRAKS